MVHLKEHYHTAKTYKGTTMHNTIALITEKLDQIKNEKDLSKLCELSRELKDLYVILGIKAYSDMKIKEEHDRFLERN